MTYFRNIYEPLTSLPLKDTLVPIIGSETLKRVTSPNPSTLIYDGNIFDQFEFLTGEKDPPISVQQFVHLNNDELLSLSDKQVANLLEIASYQLLVKNFYDHGGINQKNRGSLKEDQLRLHNLKTLQNTLAEIQSASIRDKDLKDSIQETSLVNSPLQALPWISQAYHVMQDFFVAKFRRYVIDETYDSLKGPVKKFVQENTSLIKGGKRLLHDEPIVNDERDFTLNDGDDLNDPVANLETGPLSLRSKTAQSQQLDIVS